MVLSIKVLRPKKDIFLLGNGLKNKNWVIVRDKCPQINVQFKWHTFLKKKKKIVLNGQTNGQADCLSDPLNCLMRPCFFPPNAFSDIIGLN